MKDFLKRLLPEEIIGRFIIITRTKGEKAVAVYRESVPLQLPVFLTAESIFTDQVLFL